jgi:hypothetical protein
LDAGGSKHPVSLPDECARDVWRREPGLLVSLQAASTISSLAVERGVRKDCVRASISNSVE